MSSKEKINKLGGIGNVGLLHSISIKIALIVIFAVVLTASVSLFYSTRSSEKNISTTTKNYMVDIATLVGAHIEQNVDVEGIETAMSYDTLHTVASEVNVEGMKSSYAYIVSVDGTMLYHPTVEKVGQPVENEAVKSLLASLSKGERKEPDVIEYVFKGIKKYASFYIDSKKNFIVIVTADEDEVLKSVSTMTSGLIVCAIILVIICSIEGFVIALFLTAPIVRMTKEILRLSDMDLRPTDKTKKLLKRKDEVGVMARAVYELSESLHKITEKVSVNSDEVAESSASMLKNAEDIQMAASQVEDAVKEIAQGATSQAHETEDATNNVVAMGNMIEETNRKVESLKGNTAHMKEAGQKAKEILSELEQINDKTQKSIDEIAQQTGTTNNSAQKIKEVTEIIANIAEETNLLSLNASIEAARAGETGRGFAVVAGQIKGLAEQSSKSAMEISEIVGSLIADSEKAVSIMEEVKENIKAQDTDVKKTEKAFAGVSEGISLSADDVESIVEQMTGLDELRNKVVDIVQNLSAIAQENAASSEETAASSAEVGRIMETVVEASKKLASISDELKESMKVFKL